MKIINRNENGLGYSLFYVTSDNQFYGLSTVFKIEWIYQEKNIRIEIKTGTLRGKSVSPDGKYLVLVYENNEKFAPPCNCVIYNLEGKIHKTICTPFLISTVRDRSGENEIGEIVNIQLASTKFKAWDKEDVLLISIADPVPMFRGKWTEHRVLNPITGEIGELIVTDVSEDLYEPL